jgi:hypothetical protein
LGNVSTHQSKQQRIIDDIKDSPLAYSRLLPDVGAFRSTALPRLPAHYTRGSELGKFAAQVARSSTYVSASATLNEICST